jgi:Leucine-rich repeat (LRR) protein
MAFQDEWGNTHVVIHGTKYPQKDGWFRLAKLGIQRIEEIEGLVEIGASIKRLDLHGNNIDRITNMSSLTNLVSMDLSENKISTIEGLDGLQSLQELILLNNRIKKISGLTSLKDLRYLFLAGNQIREIEGLESNTILESLWLNDNRLGSVQGLQSCTNLDELDISRNQIENVDLLAILPRLRILKASFNRIVRLPPLDTLVKLLSDDIGGFYDFSNNSIESITINKDIVINRLELYDNRIRDVSWLNKVWADNRTRDLEEALFVTLFYNPLTLEAEAAYDAFYEAAKRGERHMFNIPRS